MYSADRSDRVPVIDPAVASTPDPAASLPDHQAAVFLPGQAVPGVPASEEADEAEVFPAADDPVAAVRPAAAEPADGNTCLTIITVWMKTSILFYCHFKRMR